MREREGNVCPSVREEPAVLVRAAEAGTRCSQTPVKEGRRAGLVTASASAAGKAGAGAAPEKVAIPHSRAHARARTHAQ